MTDACANCPARTQSLHRFGGGAAALAGVLVVICVAQVALDLRERRTTSDVAIGG